MELLFLSENRFWGRKVAGVTKQEVEDVHALDRGETCGPAPALHHPLVSVNEFQFGDGLASQDGLLPRRRTGRPACCTRSCGHAVSS